MNKFLVSMFLIIFGYASLYSAPIDKNQNVVMYLISSDSWLAQEGAVHVYNQASGNFYLMFDEKKGELNVDFLPNHEEREEWELEIKAPVDQKLMTGSYMNARTYADKNNAQLRFSVGVSACYQNLSNFEILEMRRAKNGDIEALAIDFVQHCTNKQSPPVFGSFRYNSSIPIQADVSTIFGKRLSPESILYFAYTDEFFKEYPGFITSNELEFAYSCYAMDQEEGIIIRSSPNNRSLFLFDFNTVLEKGFSSGLHEESANDSHDCNRIKINFMGEEFYIGKFEVLRFKKNDAGEIVELALNFIVDASEEGFWDSFEGCIRYNTDVPIYLVNPSCFEKIGGLSEIWD